MYRAFAAALLWILFVAPSGGATDHFDVLSGIIESPQFKGKEPLEKLRIAADLLKSKKLKQSDLAFFLLDWTDRYLRGPSDPLKRLQRWADLINDEKLRNLRVPRDFLNRMLLAEYLVRKTPYLRASPRRKLEFLGKLERDKVVDWSVFLAYARIYAGGIVIRAQQYKDTTPVESLRILKKLKDEGLVGWHYRVPTEAVMAAEALALDKEYQEASPGRRLEKLMDLERTGLISTLTRKELERLPAWRLLAHDPTFLKADPAVKKERLLKLKADGLISPPTIAELRAIFGPLSIDSPVESKPAPLPRKIPPPANKVKRKPTIKR